MGFGRSNVLRSLVSKDISMALVGAADRRASAAGCAIMKTVYLPRMTARADFTCKSLTCKVAVHLN